MDRSKVIVPEFYRGYLEKAGAADLSGALRYSTKQFRKRIKRIPRKKWDFAYAPGKWTLKQMLQHIIDTERVFLFRALWFARKDPSPLPGFDENAWAMQAEINDRPWSSLVDEFLTLRKSTVQFFDSLNEGILRREGNANQHSISVAALGFLCSGHLMHHLDIIDHFYLPGKKKPSPKKPK